MKSIISIALLLAALMLHSCNTQIQKPLNGQTYYLLFFSNTLASEQELHFLSPNEVTIKLTAIGDVNGLVDLTANSSMKVYKYWLNDSVIEIPEYNTGLKIYLRKRINSFGYSTGIPPFDKGILYKTSVLDHLSDEELRLRVKNVTTSEDDVLYLLKMLKVHKREVAQDAQDKELPIVREKVEQPSDVADQVQRDIVSEPQSYAEFSEGGKVIVQVLVDKEGHIIEKKIKSSTNENLNNLALKRADETQFSKGEEKTYDLSFVFKEK